MKKKVAGVLIFVLLFSGAGIGGYWYFFGNKNKIEEITVGKNQNLIVAQISRINGNEITYGIAEEVDFQGIGGRQMDNSSAQEHKDSQENTDIKNIPENEGFSGRQNMPEEEKTGDMEEQEMSQGERPSGMREQSMSKEELPSGMGERKMPEGEPPSDMEQGEVSAESGKAEDSNSVRKNREWDKEKEDALNNKTRYTLTGEEETTLIPVGTTVTTQLGTTTTFARLAAGDMVKILMEKDENGKDVIVGIWMIG